MSEELEQDELATLQARAKQIGLKHHPKMGVEKLKKAIAAKLSDSDESPSEDLTETPDPVKEKDPTLSEDVALEKKKAELEAAGPRTHIAETRTQRKARQRREANELVRVNVACMNPNKRSQEGEIFTVSNSVVGTVKKFVQFNTENGWHVPRLILNVLEDRKCQIFVKGKDSKGRGKSTPKLIKEYAIEYLEPLTEQELKDLAAEQAVSNRLAD